MTWQKVLVGIAIALVVLLVIAWVVFQRATADPMNDMRARADALPIPADFVLVSESYRGRGFGTPAELERVYHASWPGLCDSLQSIRDRVAVAFDMAQTRGYEGRMCNHGGWYPAGRPGWFGGNRRYDLRLYGWDPEMVQGMPPDWPHGLLVLYPKTDGAPDTIRIPTGRAKVLIQVIGAREE